MKIKNVICNFLEKIIKNEKIIAWFLLIIIIAFSLFLRIYFPWKNIFSEPIKYAADDGVYHMRLIENMLLGGHFPHRLYYDAYTYFPYGTYIHFAPLYDWLLSAIIWVISFGNPTLALINKIAPFYPAVLGGLTVLIVYFIGKVLWNKWAGLFSAFLMAISQPFLFRSLLGATDHHQAEVLFSSLAILFLILTFKSEKDLKKKQFWVYAILTGIALGLYFLVWVGALLFLFIFFVSIISYYLIEYYLGHSYDWILILGSIVFLITLTMIVPFLGHPDILHSPLYNINHLGSLFLGLLAFFVLYIIGKFVKKYELQFWYFPTIIILATLFVLLLLNIFFPSVFTGIIECFKAINLGIMSQQGELSWRTHAREIIGEMHPMGIQGAVNSFGFLFHLSFIGLIFVIYDFIKKRKPESLLVIIWFLVIFLVTGIITTTFGQVRFSYYLSVNISLLCGFLGAKGLSFGIKNLQKCWKDKEVKFSNYRFIASILVIFNIVFLIFFPFPLNLIFPYPYNLPDGILGAIENAVQGASGLELDLYETLEWLKRNTPDPGLDYYAFYPEPKYNPKTGRIESYPYPETAYGIIASWDFGHMITYYSHRIPIANPFQQGLGKVNKLGEIEQVGETLFFTENDEIKATQMLDELKARYVMTDYSGAVGYGSFSGKTTWAFENEGGYYMDEEGSGKVTTRKYDKSMIVRLHFFDGRDWLKKDEEGKDIKDSYVRHLDHFRLVYESKSGVSSSFFGDEKNSDKNNLRLFKIFEYVKGAKIIGSAPSGLQIEISTAVKTNQGREFIYKKITTAQNGKFEFIIPYSTYGKDGWVENGTKFEVFASPYKIKIGEKERVINVSEKSVLEGEIINL